MARLTPCPSCTRHVKVGSSECPFCGGGVPTEVAARAIPAGRPLSRAALMFAGAAVVSACSSSSTPSTGGSDGGGTKDAHAAKDTGEDAQFFAAYGVIGVPEDAAPRPSDGGGAVDAGGAKHVDSGGAVAAYGVAIHPDGGEP